MRILEYLRDGGALQLLRASFVLFLLAISGIFLLGADAILYVVTHLESMGLPLFFGFFLCILGFTAGYFFCIRLLLPDVSRMASLGMAFAPPILYVVLAAGVGVVRGLWESPADQLGYPLGNCALVGRPLLRTPPGQWTLAKLGQMALNPTQRYYHLLVEDGCRMGEISQLIKDQNVRFCNLMEPGHEARCFNRIGNLLFQKAPPTVAGLSMFISQGLKFVETLKAQKLSQLKKDANEAEIKLTQVESSVVMMEITDHALMMFAHRLKASDLSPEYDDNLLAIFPREELKTALLSPSTQERLEAYHGLMDQIELRQDPEGWTEKASVVLTDHSIAMNFYWSISSNLENAIRINEGLLEKSRSPSTSQLRRRQILARSRIERIKARENSFNSKFRKNLEFLLAR